MLIMKILAVYGSTHQQGHARILAEVIAGAAHQHGAEVEHFDLLHTPLPPFRTDQNFHNEENVVKIRALCRDADGFILVSPEYHGCMSNWIKNFLDFHYQEFAGKLFAIAASTGGSMGVSCNTQMRVAIQHCHGWALPYQAAVKESEFDAEHRIINARAVDRLERMGRDLVVYGKLLRQQFQDDKAKAGLSDNKAEFGFGGWYAE